MLHVSRLLIPMGLFVSAVVSAQQFLPVRGIVNARDLGCNTDNFIQALDRIDREYGSLDAYLHGPMGLSDEDIQTLRARYLE